MEEIRKVALGCINQDLIQISISNSRQKEGVEKIHIRPVLLRNKLCYQAESFTKKQAFHENLSQEECLDFLCEKAKEYQQIQILHKEATVSILISKKGKVTCKKKQQENQVKMTQELTHNRKKKYLLDPHEPVPFLQDLGVQTKDGEIVKSKYDKFRQINRFLEFVEDVADVLPRDREAVIIDFGCGKSYLTFAMYYYLHEKKGLDVRMIGLDLKEEVIEHCEKLARTYGYEKLSFLTGDIADYQGVTQVDMVVTLHACDTATDYALYKAILWKASVILSVPCCQHELNKTIKNATLQPLLKYGLVKERTAALFTDALRGNLLEEAGYQVQLLEFIDLEHTPKNILIRAVKDSRKKIRLGSYKQAYEAIGANLTLYQLLHTKGKETENEKGTD